MAGSSDGKENGTATDNTPASQDKEEEDRPHSPSQTSVVISEPQYFENPVETDCPKCSEHITTVAVYKPGKLTWLSFGIVCLLGCWLGCCLIPFLLRGAKDVIHTCPKCKKEIARLRRI